jgi:branched-chain amino acid transport system substrate-binding protein
VVADYTKLITQDKVDLVLGTFSSLLNFPASAVAEKNGMVFVEPAGGAPDMFTARLQEAVLRPAGDRPAPGRRVRRLDQEPAGRPAPATAAYPTQDDPFTRPVIESMQKQLEALGVKTVYTTVYPADTTNFQTVASAIAAKKPDLVAQGAVFEDGVGLIRSLKQLNFSPKIMFQTSAPSNSSQYSDAIGSRTPRASSTRSAGTTGQDAAQPGVRRGVREAVRRRAAGRGRGRRLRRRAVLQAAAEKVGKVDQDADRDVAARQHRRDHPRPAVLDGDREPKGDFLLAQWQSGRPEIVLPEDVKTTDKVVNPKPPGSKHRRPGLPWGGPGRRTPGGRRGAAVAGDRAGTS